MPLKLSLFRPTAALLLLAATACAATGTGQRPAADPDRITIDELEANATLDLLTLIQRSRPRWLQPRGSMTFGGQVPAAVFIDGVRQMGGPGVLRALRVVEVAEAEFMSAADATTRYGIDMAGGAILVTLRR